MARGVLFGIAVAIATTAQAPLAAASEGALEVVISEADRQSDDGSVIVGLRILNGALEPSAMPLPDRIQAEIQSEGEIRKVWLERLPPSNQSLTVPARGFAHAGYRLRQSDEEIYDGAILSIPAWSRQQVVIGRGPTALPVPRPVPEIAAASSKDDPGRTAAAPPSDQAPGNAFLDNLSAYEPIYAVYGPGTNTEARVQVSFKYRLFGSRRQNGLSPSWREGVHIAFTQRMFWELGAESSPFRNIDYLPELLYLSPTATLTSGVTLVAQTGIRHESNGRDGLESRSLNTLYVAPMAAVPLGGGYRVTVSPRLSFLVGDRGDNPDILRYRGTASLFAELGKDDGLRLSTATRFNFSSGKGAVSADLSYPLSRLLGGGPDLYLFGQSFIGYGENLLDYDRRTTRFRVGLAIVR